MGRCNCADVEMLASLSGVAAVSSSDHPIVEAKLFTVYALLASCIDGLIA
jgi:hypothetical protein